MATIKFVPERSSAPRIPDETWNEFRQIITEKFTTDSLPNVMIFMQREHNFSASKRQYVYRLGQWGCTKYNKSNAKADPSPVAEAVPDNDNAVYPNPDGPPCLDIPALPPQDVAGLVLASPTPVAPNSNFREQQCSTQRSWALLADILFAFGATGCSFNINVYLRDAVACIRAAQTRAQDLSARNLATDFLGTGARPEQTWETRFWELAVAHTWGRDSDAEDGLQQIIKTTKAIITDDYDSQHDEFQDRLQPLAPREPRLDIPAFIFLRSAMEWHKRELNEEFDIPGLIDQFICQQLAPRGQERRVGPLSIECIAWCLAWCIDTLRDPQTTPPGDLPPPHGKPAETYLVLCTLWRLWIAQHPTHPAPLPWADHCEPQLGIRPTELLSTVVCMIMAAIPQHVRYPNTPLLKKALAGARELDRLNRHNLHFGDPSSETLLDRFLRQVWVTNAPLLAQPGEGRQFHLRRGAVDARAFQPYVVFAGGVLGFPGLSVGEGAVVYPIVLAVVE